jgi:glycine cleavage system H protein
MNHPAELRYSKTHEWLRVDGQTATVGITDYAQEELGDIVFLELPEVGRRLRQQEVFGAVESVKAVSDLYAPVSGEVTRANANLPSTPEQINQDPYAQGWMIELRMDNPTEVDGLLTADQYEQLIASE